MEPTGQQEHLRCGSCGGESPAGARFCVECGAPLSARATAHLDEPEAPPAATGATVRLSNARVEQAVLGGTIRLATAEAVPPGLWMPASPPGAEDTVAIYAPLRAIVGGWSGLVDSGWRLIAELPPERGSTQPRFRFEAEREWFPAPGYGADARLAVRIQAEAEAEEGRTRRGFRYRAAHDPPMAVAGAAWRDRRGGPLALPLPKIQVMAPPRVPRVSDYPERIGALPPQQALAFAQQGKVHEQLHLLQDRQQRTPVGRALPLGAIDSLGLMTRLFGGPRQPRYHVQMRSPLRCSWREWLELQPKIGAAARQVGLELETDATVEWWLDREAYDGVVLEGVAEKYRYRRVALAFRRAQVVMVEGT